MKHLALKIGQLKKADYDRKVFTGTEVAEKLSTETSKSIALCDKHGIDASIVASELIHSKEELVTLKGKTLSFRESGSNDEKIAELEELVSELEAVMKEKFDHASRMEAHTQREDKHAKALKALEPLADELVELEKKMKDNFANIKEVEGSVFDNTLNPDTFRLMNAMSRPSGVFN